MSADSNKTNLELSLVNIFPPPYHTPTSECSISAAAERPELLAQNRDIVLDSVNRIFVDKLGQAEVSSSHCSSLETRSSAYSYDNRLEYWKNVLEQRKRVQAHIQSKTGKTSAQVLFNRAVTIDERDKQTVRRIMDYADRLNPSKLLNKRELILPERINSETCPRHINELRETLPKSERNGEKIVEIIGLPAVTKEELLGKPKEQGEVQKSSWLKSRVLEQTIERKLEDIERVIEFYPDIENLQIVGMGINQGRHSLQQHNADIKYLGEEIVNRLSEEETALCQPTQPPTTTTTLAAAPTLTQPPPDYSVKINEHVFEGTENRSSKYVEVEASFECQPFERIIKRILHVENIGKKVLSFVWVERPYYVNTRNLLRVSDDEFIFEHKPFRLAAGESIDIVVQFQPRRVDVVKQKWMLKIDPQFFCRKIDAVLVRLCGKCKPSPEYVEKIRTTMKAVLDKSNKKMAGQLTTGLASITPLIKPADLICPYKRTLNELELFEFLNPGYRCKRYHDIHLLKAMHQRCKQPREAAWDLRVETLKALILAQPRADRRALLYAEMTAILDEMRSQPDNDFEEKVPDNTERERTCFVYVRGIILAGIDEWQDLVWTIEEAFHKVAWKEYLLHKTTHNGQEEDNIFTSIVRRDDGAGGDAEQQPNDLYEEDIKLCLAKELRHRKAFRDTLYMQTYTHLCNFIEDIVAVIESTDIA